MSANPHRGEARLTVGGETILVRPSFGALVAAEEELGPLRRQAAAEPCDVERFTFSLQAAPQRSQRIQHHPGVVGVEQVVDRRRAFGQAGEQQHAV